MNRTTELDRVTMQYALTVCGFRFENMGGNTAAFIREHGQWVDIVTASYDSLPPRALTDEALAMRYHAGDFAAWNRGEIDTMDETAQFVGTCRDALLWSHGE